MQSGRVLSIKRPHARLPFHAPSQTAPSERGGSYVCDVNGWSFVKGSTKYYEDAADILRRYVRIAVSVERHTIRTDSSAWACGRIRRRCVRSAIIPGHEAKLLRRCVRVYGELKHAEEGHTTRAGGSGPGVVGSWGWALGLTAQQRVGAGRHISFFATLTIS